MEEPYSGVIGDDSKDDLASARNMDGISSHRVSLALLDFAFIVGIVVRAMHELHLMAVQVATNPQLITLVHH